MYMQLRHFAYIILLAFVGTLAFPSAVYAQKSLPKIIRPLTGKSARAVSSATQSNAAKVLRFAPPTTPSMPSAVRPVRSKLPPAVLSELTLSPAQIEKIIKKSQSASSALTNQNATFWFAHARAQHLLQATGHPLKALHTFWQLRNYRYYRFLFSFLASAYYKQHFVSFTPHLMEFFKKVGRFQNQNLEYQVMKRVVFLAENKERLHAAISPNTRESGLRLRYLKDVTQLTPQTFSPHDLVLSFERQMSPGQPTSAIRHISIKSRFDAGLSKSYPVYRYDGPLELMPQLYEFLIYGNGPQRELVVIFDKDSRSMLIYNKDRSVWLRITPHEYASADKLHLHLNEKRLANITNGFGYPFAEMVALNLAIPLARPQNIPAQTQEKYLYQKMVLQPLQYFKTKKFVTVLERPIF